MVIGNAVSLQPYHQAQLVVTGNGASLQPSQTHAVIGEGSSFQSQQTQPLVVGNGASLQAQPMAIENAASLQSPQMQSVVALGIGNGAAQMQPIMIDSCYCPTCGASVMAANFCGVCGALLKPRWHVVDSTALDVPAQPVPGAGIALVAEAGDL